MNYPQFVKVIDVSPRDGLQNEKTLLSVADKVWLIDALSETGLTAIEAGSFVSPQWVPQMADTDKVYQAIQKKAGVSYPVLVPNQQGFQTALNLGVQEISVFTAVSETFCQKNINCSIQESFERFRPVLEQAQKERITVRGYISCVMGCPYEGPVSDQKTNEIARRLLEMGCSEISLGDTIGVGTPLKVEALLNCLLSDMKATSLAVHFHDTYGQALANILQSLQMGITTVDASVAGLGGCPYAKGASGNVATEDVVYMLNGMGIQTGIDLEKLSTVGHGISKRLNLPNRSKAGTALG